MNQQKITPLLFIYLLCVIFIISCNHSKRPADKKIVSDPAKMDQETGESIKLTLDFALQHNGVVNDSIRLKMTSLVNDFYNENEYTNIWSHKEKWDPLADTLINFIQNGELYGLFPKDYHLKSLQSLKTVLQTDSVKRTDAELWTRADLMLTDGFMHLIKDLKIGRLAADTVLFNKNDTLTKKDFYTATLKTFIEQKQINELVNAIEPKQHGYQELKKLIPHFLDSIDRTVYTYVNYPFKSNDIKDSIWFIKMLQKRLKESGIEPDPKLPDSIQLREIIKKFQKKKGVKPDGKITAPFVRLVNLSDLERFKRIAITLDRYKQLPPVMPEKYILVNLPAYYLNVWDHDSVAIFSKIICGKPDTRTPLLNSVISDMVTYPTWTVPTSIIVKNKYLDKLKVNPNYLTRIGLHLEDNKGETVDPTKVKWAKFKKGIPYKVMQGSGDDNALGILKFNFRNPYAVYLHDTNERWLFKNTTRDLSHGCVRVQQWEELAFFITRNDSMNLKPGESMKYNEDSIKNWLANKEQKRIAVKNGLPLFIAYFSCEGKGEKIRFYDDIYGEDKLMREKYFSDK